MSCSTIYGGKGAEQLIVTGAKVGAEAVPVRFVQIGSVTAANVTLPSAALRSSAIVLMGSGIGGIPFDRLLQAIGGVLRATGRASRLPSIPCRCPKWNGLGYLTTAPGGQSLQWRRHSRRRGQ
jgi:hypothetical protein